MDGTALAGTRNLEELINAVFEAHTKEDLNRIDSLRDVRQSIQREGGGIDRVGNRRGEPDALKG